MPQVEREADRAQVLGGARGEQPVGAPGAARHDDRDRRQHRPQREVAGEGGADVEDRAARHQARDADPAEHGAGDPAQPHPVDHEGEDAAERELPDARAGVEVGEGLVGRRGDHRVGEGRERDRGEGREQRGAHVGATEPRPPRHGEHQQRGQHVELRLDRQRPEVLGDARGAVVGVVVDRVQRQAPVLDEERRGQQLVQVARPRRGRQQHRRDHRADGQDQPGGGDEPPEQPGPGGGERDPLAPDRAARGHPEDEEAREQEEDVDAAGDAPDPDVVDDDEDGGETPQPLDLGTARAAGRARRAIDGLETRHSCSPSPSPRHTLRQPARCR